MLGNTGLLSDTRSAGSMTRVLCGRCRSGLTNGGGVILLVKRNGPSRGCGTGAGCSSVRGTLRRLTTGGGVFMNAISCNSVLFFPGRVRGRPTGEVPMRKFSGARCPGYVCSGIVDCYRGGNLGPSRMGICLTPFVSVTNSRTRGSL